MSVQTEQTITSLEVAELTGKRQDQVLRDIRNILSQLDEIGQSNFGETTYTVSRNRKQTCYSLSDGRNLTAEFSAVNLHL